MRVLLLLLLLSLRMLRMLLMLLLLPESGQVARGWGARCCRLGRSAPAQALVAALHLGGRAKPRGRRREPRAVGRHTL